MSITSREAILKVLNAYNPWWRTGGVNAQFVKKYKRLAYYEAMNKLEESQIRRAVVLSGARRVGKTTIQYQIIESLLNEGVSPKRILFVSLDHPMLKLGGISEVLECYHENVCPDQQVYYFFDEIQYAGDWDKWLKTLYDMQPETKIVATGSASPVLVKGSEESGVGRWSIIQVPTLSFYEYCSLIGVNDIEIDKNVKVTNFIKLSREKQQDIMRSLLPLQNHFNRYLQVGGFPELALAESDMMAQQVLREDVVDKAIKRDLPALYNIRNVTELERIFLYLCNVSSNVVSINALTKELDGVKRSTVENYINYLESASLIYQSFPVEMSGKKILKSSPKIYVADAAMRNAVLMDENVLTNPEEMGKMVETAVYKHVKAFYYQKATRVGYYRGGTGDKEIDLVVEYPNIKKILIEVKYREAAHISDKDAICQMAHEGQAAIVVTKSADDFGEHNCGNGAILTRIPAFAFLYLLGHAEKNWFKI